MAVTTLRRPLPAGYYYFFWLVEPALTIAGAVQAMFMPEVYGAGLLSTEERTTKSIGNTVRGQIIIGSLGSCFLLFAMLSLSMFPIIKHSLPDRPDIQQRLVKGLLIPLAIADITHILMCILPLPMSLLQSPWNWTVLMHGNVFVTAFLFIVRMSYLSGLGRGSVRPANSAKKVA